MLKLFKILPKAIIQNSFICKKIYITTILVILSSFCSVAQSIFPDGNDEYCPGQDIVFTVTLPVEVTGLPAVMPMSGPGITAYPYDFISFFGSTTFKFKARFLDENRTQKFQVRYTPKGSTEITKEFVYKKIKSLKNTTIMYPNRYTIDVERCKQSTFNIYFDNLKYSGDPFEIPTVVFGDINQYEYLLPKDWKLNGIPSDGSSWMKADNSVSITSDPSHGDKESIQIRAVNGCDPTGFLLAKGQIKNIPISRPAPTLEITPYNASICGVGGSESFTLKGTPADATVIWSVSDPTQATVTPSPTNQNLITVTRIGSANTNLVVTATVKYCSFMNTATQNVLLGTIPIEFVPYAPMCSPAVFTLCAKPVIDAASHYWEARVGSSTVSLPESGDWCVDVPLNTLRVNLFVTNKCGVTTQKGQLIRYLNCGDAARVEASPNPATNTINIKILDGDGFTQVRVVDKLGNVFKQFNYPKSTIQTQLSVGDLHTGIYFIKVFNGKDWQTVSIIKL